MDIFAVNAHEAAQAALHRSLCSLPDPRFPGLPPLPTDRELWSSLRHFQPQRPVACLPPLPPEERVDEQTLLEHMRAVLRRKNTGAKFRQIQRGAHGIPAPVCVTGTRKIVVVLLGLREFPQLIADRCAALRLKGWAVVEVTRSDVLLYPVETAQRVREVVRNTRPHKVTRSRTGISGRIVRRLSGGIRLRG